MSGQISIQSNEIDAIAASFSEIATSVNSGTEKLSSGFKALQEAGLFEEGLKIIADNANQVAEVVMSMSVMLSQHLGSIRDGEQSGAGRVRDYSGGGSYTPPNTENPSNPVEGIIISLGLTDKNSFSNLIHNINQLRGELSLEDILLNNENNATLFKILKEQLGIEGEFDEEQIREIKKALINKMFEEELEIEELKLETGYMLREILLDFAKENKITVGDLLVEPRYEGIYRILLNKIYAGEYEKKFTPEEFERVKAYISKHPMMKVKEKKINGDIFQG